MEDQESSAEKGQMEDFGRKIAANRKLLYPLLGAVAGVVLLGLVWYIGAAAVYVLGAIGGGALIGHLVRKYADDEF